MSAPAPPPDPTATIVVNGLSMTVELYERTMAAIRGLYPTLTDGLSDEAAVQALMRFAVVGWITTWETQQAGDPNVAAEAARQTALAAQRAALTKAQADTESITVTTTT